jgi:hypothetical protein
MTMPRTRLIILALIAGIVVLATLVLTHNRAASEASALVLDVNTRSLGNWDPEPVLSHAHDSLLADAGPDFFHTYFRALQRLGNLQEIRDITFELTLSPPWTLYRAGSAHYTMNASFSAGQAEIRMTLIRENGRWMIGEYLVLTPALAS